MRVLVVTAVGDERELSANIGQSLSTAIRGAGIALGGATASSCGCPACHVIIGSAWDDKLPNPDKFETQLLKELPDSSSNSRLACSIELTEELSGIRVTLPVQPAESSWTEIEGLPLGSPEEGVPEFPQLPNPDQPVDFDAEKFTELEGLNLNREK